MALLSSRAGDYEESQDFMGFGAYWVDFGFGVIGLQNLVLPVAQKPYLFRGPLSWLYKKGNHSKEPKMVGVFVHG